MASGMGCLARPACRRRCGRTLCRGRILISPPVSEIQVRRLSFHADPTRFGQGGAHGSLEGTRPGKTSVRHSNPRRRPFPTLGVGIPLTGDLSFRTRNSSHALGPFMNVASLASLEASGPRTQVQRTQRLDGGQSLARSHPPGFEFHPLATCGLDMRASCYSHVYVRCVRVSLRLDRCADYSEDFVRNLGG